MWRIIYAHQYIYTYIMVAPIILAIVLVIVAIWYLSSEHFGPCRLCDQRTDLARNAVINPFVWPYSGGWNPDSNNAQEYLARLKSRNTPDHAPETE